MKSIHRTGGRAIGGATSHRWWLPGRLLVLACALAAAGQARAQVPVGLGGYLPPSSYGYLGLSLGEARFDPTCQAGLSCDRKDRGLKLTAGARTQEVWGAEFSLIDFGEATASGASQRARALAFSGTANLEFVPGFLGFARLGLAYSRTKSGVAAGQASGSKGGIGPHWGLGLAYAMDPQWTLVGEYEQHRVRFAAGRQTLGLLSLGVRYTY